MSAQSPSDAERGNGPAQEPVEVLFRKAAPPTDRQARYPGFRPGRTRLNKGSVHGRGALPLPCDILLERDAAVPLRDGSIIYADIFRPLGTDKVPTIVAWGPYGKGCGWLSLDLPSFPNRWNIPVGALSNLQSFEGPDPAYWCNHGYAVANVDARGVFMSEGDIRFWGTQEAQDGYDFIEWVAAQGWSNGKIGLSGNSWLAISQWHIAAQRPPHLAAIAPWEGECGPYSEDNLRGGIPETAFWEIITSHLYGSNRVEDYPAMIARYPLWNSYWRDKAADVEKIEVPTYAVTSYTHQLHAHGTFDGFRRVAHQTKWLRIHNTMEWYDYYDAENVEDLRFFFDCYLKGLDNGWEETPKVRMAVLDPGGVDVVKRAENEFPLARTRYQILYLDASAGVLLPERPTEGMISYRADDDKGEAAFVFRFNTDTELTGYMKLRLWVAADQADDMDLFVYIQKVDAQGNMLPIMMLSTPNVSPVGRLRVSHRQLDPLRSTPQEPYLTHAVEERLGPGEIVPVEIAIRPLGMRWHAGQQLRVAVTGYCLSGGQAMQGVAAPTVLRNKGKHTIYTGGRYDSHLLVPAVAGAEFGFA